MGGLAQDVRDSLEHLALCRRELKEVLNKVDAQDSLNRDDLHNLVQTLRSAADKYLVCSSYRHSIVDQVTVENSRLSKHQETAKLARCEFVEKFEKETKQRLQSFTDRVTRLHYSVDRLFKNAELSIGGAAKDIVALRDFRDADERQEQIESIIPKPSDLSDEYSKFFRKYRRLYLFYSAAQEMVNWANHFFSVLSDIPRSYPNDYPKILGIGGVVAVLPIVLLASFIGWSSVFLVFILFGLLLLFGNIMPLFSKGFEAFKLENLVNEKREEVLSLLEEYVSEERSTEQAEIRELSQYDAVASNEEARYKREVLRWQENMRKYDDSLKRIDEALHSDCEKFSQIGARGGVSLSKRNSPEETLETSSFSPPFLLLLGHYDVR